MSWRDQLQPGSVNGIAVAFEADEATVGRRVHVHEYPLRDVPYVEDLGRKARGDTLEVFLVGDDFMSRRDALINELEKPGPVTLVHRYYGSRRATLVEPARIRHSAREGGYCAITLNFVEAGAREYPTVRPDTVSLLNLDADAAITELGESFADVVATDNYPGFVRTGLVGELDSGLSFLRELNGKVNTALAPVVSVSQQIDALTSGIVDLLNTPHDFVASVAGVVGAVLGTATRVADVVRGYRGIMDNARVYVPNNGTTAARVQQAANTQAVGQLFRAAAVVEAARTVTNLSASIDITSNTQSPFDSLDEAIVVRDELLAALDDEALQGSDALYRALADLQHQLIAHIKAHGQTLPRVAYKNIAAPVPSLVLAHSLYGNIDNEADIVRRNKIRRPGFVREGRTLEYLLASA